MPDLRAERPDCGPDQTRSTILQVDPSSHSPETMTSGAQTNMPKDTEFRMAQESLAGWHPKEVAESLSKESLESVTRLTEYQDDKANRILTAAALLATLAGVLYSALAPRDTSQNVVFTSSKLSTGAQILLWGFHGLFAAFCLCVAVGTFLVILGIRPRFRLPVAADGKPSVIGSPLFAIDIAKRSIADWTSLFASKSEADLSCHYTRSRVLEIHLVAEKVVEKLRVVQLGVGLFLLSTGTLAAWFVLAVLLKVLVSVPTTP